MAKSQPVQKMDQRLHSRIWESESSSPSPPRPESETFEPVGAQFRYYSEATLRTLQTLPSEEFILLFTPIVPHPSRSAPQTRSADPFEPLGRALSKYHARIRHVPYIPNVGFTDTLQVFLQQAGAVIVVWCEPTSTLTSHEQLYMPGCQNLATKTFMDQSQFLKNVRRAMNPHRSRIMDKGHKPLVVVTTGPPGCLLDQNVGMHDYDTVIYCNYDTQVLSSVPDALFDNEMNGSQSVLNATSGEVSKLSLANPETLS